MIGRKAAVLWALAATGLGVSRFAAAAGGAQPVARPAASQAATERFEAQVRPLLLNRCGGCHGGGKAQGGLSLESRAALLAGGTHGPAVLPGDPDRSRLMQAVRYQGALRMPPSERLTPDQVQLLADWISEGAVWPSAPAKGRVGAAHWAFQPLRAPRFPAIRGTATQPIDRFILAGLEQARLTPNPPADRRTLLRRATFDLTGLPPTPEEVDAFLSDPAPGAFARVVDRLLDSPAFGERWGRHWLDVARYSDSNGRDWNEVFPNAWRYRDWVIRAFNQDLPFNEFVRRQLSGDLLPARDEQERYDHLVATGFLVMGPKLLAQQDRIQLALDIVDEQIDVTSKAFLGLTVSCARCHDHKFDPISTREYYALAGIFKSTRTLGDTLPRNNRVMYWMERPLAEDTRVAAFREHQTAVRKMQDAVKKCKDGTEKAQLTAELKALEARAPAPVPMAMAVIDGRGENMRVHRRGSYQDLGEEAPRGFPAVLGGGAAAVPASSGRRELADWIAAPENPLTSRVMVNRVWSHLFGRGIVATPDNFGAQGELPSHPELLDYLARSFVSEGWSVKKLIRRIMLTAAYQRTGTHSAAAYARDPANRLLWRANRRRLEAEAIRDAMLAANASLDLQAGGTLLTKAVGFPVKEFPVDFTVPRRSVYLPVLRNNVFELMQCFDFADPSIVMGRRETTTVATQALVLMNSPFVMDQARTFARLLLEMPAGDDARITAAYQRTLGRVPSASEVARVLAYLQQASEELTTSLPNAETRRLEAWRTFCQTLYASAEFRYVD
jgi:cytochrome c553